MYNVDPLYTFMVKVNRLELKGLTDIYSKDQTEKF